MSVQAEAGELRYLYFASPDSLFLNSLSKLARSNTISSSSVCSSFWPLVTYLFLLNVVTLKSEKLTGDPVLIQSQAISAYRLHYARTYFWTLKIALVLKNDLLVFKVPLFIFCGIILYTLNVERLMLQKMAAIVIWMMFMY